MSDDIGVLGPRALDKGTNSCTNCDEGMMVDDGGITEMGCVGCVGCCCCCCGGCSGLRIDRGNSSSRWRSSSICRSSSALGNGHCDPVNDDDGSGRSGSVLLEIEGETIGGTMMV